MAETTDSGTDWGALASLLAGVIGGMSSGQSLLGEPNKQVSNTGPLTPEGQRIMDEYTRALDSTPVMSRFRFGGQDFSLPNKRRLGVLKNMTALEAIRRGNLSQQPAETGILGKLAPLLASMGKKDIWGGISQPKNGGTTYTTPGVDNFIKTGDLSGIYGTSEGE